MEQIVFKAQKKINLSSICDLFNIPSEWELCAWPISYNESVSFIFRNVNDGDVLDEGGDKKLYRFKIFTVSDFDFSHAIKKDVELNGMALVTMFYWENGYVFAVRDNNDCAQAVFYDHHEEHTDEINLGPGVDRLMVTKDGRIAVGYIGTYPNDLPCFAVISPIGKEIFECRKPSARACIDLTVDRNDNIWASCFPDILTYEVKTNGDVVEHTYPVASPDSIIPFELNGKTAMILSYGNENVYVPVNYLCVDDKLREVIFDDLNPDEIEGISAYAGLVIVLTKSNKLYFFRLDEASRALE